MSEIIVPLFVWLLKRIRSQTFFDNHFVRLPNSNLQKQCYTTWSYKEGDEYPHAYLWDQGKIIDLTEELRQQISAKWLNSDAVAINNLGQVAITASRFLGNNKRVTKSFIWKDATFTAVLPTKSLESNVQIKAIDDFGNMLVHVSEDFAGGFSSSRSGSYSRLWFINPSESFKANIRYGCNLIRNKKPIREDCLPGKIKRTFDGQFYFGHGVNIMKLIVVKELYDPLFDTQIADQNSKGWVVGRMGTLYSTNHAFLAIPVLESSETIKISD